MNPSLPRALAGAAAGFLGTLPMSIVMLAFHRTLPWTQRDPLPPAQVTDRLLAKIDLADDLSHDQRSALTAVNHFAYGAAMGGLYGTLTPDPLNKHPVSSGVAYGLTVWAGSYFGLLPSLGLYRPATREPLARNLLLIGAHVVWGASLGLMTDRLSRWSLRLSRRTPRQPESAIHAA
jgi:hypothetical protein